MLSTDSRSTGIGGVSSLSSSGSVLGLSGPHTDIPLVIVAGAFASTLAVTFTVIVPPTGMDLFVVTFAILPVPLAVPLPLRSEEHTSELQSLMRLSYAAFFL